MLIIKVIKAQKAEVVGLKKENFDFDPIFMKIHEQDRMSVNHQSVGNLLEVNQGR